MNKDNRIISSEKIAFGAGLIIGSIVLAMSLIFRENLPEDFILLVFFIPLFATLIFGIALEVLFKVTTGSSRKRGMTITEVGRVFEDATISFALYKLLISLIALGASYCSVAFLIALINI